MTFDRPAFLAVALAAWLVWIWRRRPRAAAVTVSSVAPFRGGDAAPAVRPARRADAATWLSIAAAAALALAAAGLRPGPRSAPRILVVADGSPSMSAVVPDGADTRTVGELALAAAMELAAASGGEVVVRRLAAGDGRLDVAAEASAEAAALGLPGAIVATDRPVPAPHVAVSGRVAAGPNVGITAVDADRADARMLVRVENFGDSAVDVTVACGAASVAARLGARAFADVALPRPEGGGDVRLAPGGSLAADDVVRVHARPVPRTVRLSPPGATKTARALAAAGFATTEGGDADLVVVVGPERPPAGGPWIALSVTPGPRGSFDVVPGPDRARGAEITGDPALAPLLPAPGGSFAATGRIRGGRSVLADGAGALGADVPGGTAFTLDPEGAWGDDPSFPVLLVAAAERLLGPPPPHADPTLPRDECDVPTSPLPRPGDAAAAAAIRSLLGPPAYEAPAAAPWLLAAAALLALGAAAAGRR